MDDLTKKKKNNMRKVMVSENTYEGIAEKGEAVFHQFGSDYIEFESWPGNITTAIVEWPDGTVESVVLEHIRFLDKEICHSCLEVPEVPRPKMGIMLKKMFKRNS